ncbi:MAG TPA: M20/M25/M40 family metallo-hydrolase [Terriglobales bacterium]|jgi:putative aminopeptidase|nr:M20/M25/M40 family metallo-hydrolase [Terriglobales bacterium]
MNRPLSVRLIVLIGILSVTPVTVVAAAKGVPGDLLADMQQYVQTPAAPGYEQELSHLITQQLASYSPKVDSLGNVVITIGSGAPNRLLIAPIDEPGYVVSDITAQGYLRLQRLPQFGALPLFNELYSAQPVQIHTAQGKWIAGVIAGPSVHLQPGRSHPPDLDDIENMYVDIGAASAAQARSAGADVLSPLAIDRRLYQMGFGKWTAPAIGDRFGAAALVEVLRVLDPQKLRGRLTVAFVTQQWTGARGLQRMLDEVKPDELLYVGRLTRGPAPPGPPGVGKEIPQPKQKPGSGVLIAETPEQQESPLASELTQLARQNKIPLVTDYSAPLMPRGYLPQPPLPPRWAHLGVPTAWASTPGEFLDAHDLSQLVTLLETYLQGEASVVNIPNASTLAEPALPSRPAAAPTPETILRDLVETYGVSDHETRVREAIARLLPAWAKPQTDSSGNLILHWPGKGPRLVVVAHQDEIGYEVRSILPDGTLELEDKGGGLPPFFLGHAGFVHTATGIRPGVLELPQGWDQSAFHWPPESRNATYRMDVGAANPQQAAELGIKIGDFVTIPKKYRRLLGTRVNARSFDDRLGCTALLAATWSLGPQLGGRDVTFVWSTGEELGLVGAAAVAKSMAAAGRAPEYVFAVDTFVSSDSPLESTRFADAKVGEGFVVRAVDNSNVVPRKLVEKLVALARAQGIPAQYGVTGGGNDGAAFLRYGSTDVALGWPLRYSHSPGEVVDTRDVDALAHIVAAVARQW